MKVSHAHHDYLKLYKDPLEKYLCAFSLMLPFYVNHEKSESKSSRLSYILVEPLLLEMDKCKSVNAASVSEVLALLNLSPEGHI